MNHQDVDTSSFKNLYEDRSFFLLDVRTPEEYTAGHLKGAVNINFYEQTFEEKIDSLDKRKKYLVYCRSGGRSRQTMFLMRDLGFEEVCNLSGGILSWSEHGFELQN